MAFSENWENEYAQGRHISVWPWSDLISLFYRSKKSFKSTPLRVLELGCGAGANIDFFEKFEDVEYFAIEGSQSIVDYLYNKYPHLKDNIKLGDFTSHLPFDGEFDIIFDRASITHNNTSSIEKCIDLINRKLKTDGHFVGVHWFSTENTFFNSSHEVDGDYFTRGGFSAGPYVGIEPVHFSSREHLEGLFKGFEFSYLEHGEREIFEEGGEPYKLAHWNFVVEKK